MQKINTKFLRWDYLICDRPTVPYSRFMDAEGYRSFLAQKRAKLTRNKYYINPLKRARRYQALLDADPSLNKSKLAKKLGTSRVRITQILGLLNLPLSIQDDILSRKGITERSLRPLIGIQNQDALRMEFEQLLKSSMS